MRTSILLEQRMGAYLHATLTGETGVSRIGKKLQFAVDRIGILRRIISPRLRLPKFSALALAALFLGIGESHAVEIIKDNSDATGVTITGSWVSSTTDPGYYGTNYFHDSNTGKGTKSVLYTPTIPSTGQYLVYARWTAGTSRAPSVPITVTHAAGVANLSVNQQTYGSTWFLLGSYTFNAGTAGTVLISNTGTTGHVIADGVRFVSVDPSPAGIIQDNMDASGVTVTGAWTASTTATGYNGTNYWHDGNAGKGTKSVRFTPNIPSAGNYHVYMRWVSSSSYASNVPVTITHAKGTTDLKIDERFGGATWSALGTFSFNAGTAGNVLISTTGTTGHVIVDAIKYVPTADMIIDANDTTGITKTGTWTASTSTTGYYGSNYLHDGNSGKGSKSVKFAPNFSSAGVYDVQTRWTADTTRASNVPISIVHNGVTNAVAVNQQLDGSQWISLGLYDFAAGATDNVLISNTATSAFVIADAVKFVRQTVVDDASATEVTINGAWTTSTSPSNYYGSGYRHDGNAGKGSKSLTFTPNITYAERYDVYMRWTAAADRASNVPVYIASAGGTRLVTVDQRSNGGEWVFMGNYLFHAGTSGNIRVSNYGTSGYVSADAVRLTPFDYPPNRVSVVSPEYCTDISGNTAISIVAPGFTSAVAKCWQSGGTYGSDSTVATIQLDSGGGGQFVFPAGSYPHGPITIRITGTNGSISDTCYLQLYNTGGTVWNQGIPASVPAPAAAAGLSLVFSDDFNSMPSISSDGAGATYSAHKPGGGDFSGIPFSNPAGVGNPFSQVDSYLRIRADSNLNTTGLISSLRADGTGFLAHCPAYFECRFIAPSAPGTWPAFWLLSYNGSSFTGAVDELDIVEAYGGEGTGTPNTPQAYLINSHNWGQTGIPSNQKISKSVNMAPVGGGAGWMYTPHVYGCLITETDTIYYLDNVEVGRHQTSPVSKTDGFWFMVNLAVGGTSGWHKDLSRYDGVTDMYIDYVRVYAAP